MVTQFQVLKNQHQLALNRQAIVIVFFISPCFLASDLSTSRMAMMHSNQVQLKQTGGSCTVPNNHKARLMYYLKCMYNVISDDGEDTDGRLMDYDNHWRLSEVELDALLLLCVLLSPDELIDKCIFCAPSLCGESTNKFYEISQVSNTLLVSSSVLIGGQRRQVKKIMAYKEQWLIEYYYEPVVFYAERIKRIARSGSRRPRRCVIS